MTRPIENKFTVTAPESWNPANHGNQSWLLSRALHRVVWDHFDSSDFRGRTITITMHEDGHHATAELVPQEPRRLDT